MSAPVRKPRNTTDESERNAILRMRKGWNKHDTTGDFRDEADGRWDTKESRSREVIRLRDKMARIEKRIAKLRAPTKEDHTHHAAIRHTIHGRIRDMGR